MYVFIFTCMHVCMYVCMHVCMNVCTSLCICVCARGCCKTWAQQGLHKLQRHAMLAVDPEPRGSTYLVIKESGLRPCLCMGGTNPQLDPVGSICRASFQCVVPSAVVLATLWPPAFCSRSLPPAVEGL